MSETLCRAFHDKGYGTRYLGRADLGDYAQHLCADKCSVGCVGCNCVGYDEATLGANAMVRGQSACALLRFSPLFGCRIQAVQDYLNTPGCHPKVLKDTSIQHTVLTHTIK